MQNVYFFNMWNVRNLVLGLQIALNNNTDEYNLLLYKV